MPKNNHKNKNQKKRSIILLIIIYFLVGIFGLYISFYPTINSKFNLMQNDPGDTLLNNYSLEHSYKFFFDRGYQASFWSPNIFYPAKNILAYSENLLGSSFIYFLLRPIFARDTSFQLWMIIIFILNYLAFALMLRKFGVSNLLAILGGFLFAFSLPRMMQLGHQQLLPQFYTPLFFIFFWSFCLKPNFRDLLLSLSMLYLQILSGIYLGWFLILSLIIFGLILFIVKKEMVFGIAQFLKSQIYKSIFLFASFLLMFGLFSYPYIKTMQLFGKRSYGEVFSMLPRIKSWLAADGFTIWGKPLENFTLGLPMRHEHLLFMGFSFILLSFFALYFLFWLERKNQSKILVVARIFFLIFITIFILSLKIPQSDKSIWKIIYDYYPGAGSIRAVTRIALVAYFYLIAANIIAFDYFLGKRIVKGRVVFIVLAVIILIAEQISFKLPSFDKIAYQKESAEFNQALASPACSIYYYSFPGEEKYLKSQIQMMLASLEMNRKVINGYSGNQPLNYKSFTQPLNLIETKEWLNYNDLPSNFCFIVDKKISPEVKLSNNLDNYVLLYETENYLIYKI